MRLAIYGILCPVCHGTKQKVNGILRDGDLESTLIEDCDACDEFGIQRAPVDHRNGVAWEGE